MQKNINRGAVWKIASYLIKAIFISKRKHHRIASKLSLERIRVNEVASIDNERAACNLLYSLHFLTTDKINSVRPILADNLILYTIPTTHLLLRIQSTMLLTTAVAYPILRWNCSGIDGNYTEHVRPPGT